MSFSVIIPARFGSSRLPGKPLLDICGQPMIQRVWQQACRSNARQVVIATDDERIRDACRQFGAEVVMTATEHQSGTDRLEEVARKLALPEDHSVINVQGDEPMMPPQLINQVAGNLERFKEAAAATLCERLDDPSQVGNPNIVKVVFDKDGYAHYFSRAPIPWFRDGWTETSGDLSPRTWFRHIGIYGYRAGLLRRFVSWGPAPLERVESLEQLRILHHSEKLHVDEAVCPLPGGVDTQADLERVRRQFATALEQGNAAPGLETPANGAPDNG